MDRFSLLCLAQQNQDRQQCHRPLRHRHPLTLDERLTRTRAAILRGSPPEPLPDLGCRVRPVGEE
jgi:hypothetical protein